jgi:FixJ family two-component response regulator
VILDVYMPNMNGLELQRHLIATHPIPIIFITAYGDTRTRTRAMNAGALDFLEKPFDDNVLLDRIRVALETP